jgi:hypothetical protein
MRLRFAKFRRRRDRNVQWALISTSSLAHDLYLVENLQTSAIRGPVRPIQVAAQFHPARSHVHEALV